ncbi:Stimulator of interferon genes [Paramuricea clavata]|uniref:Stimulator of interferon genes n=1 Tax=Paramuricea clavata TaxID=317549 RepID=A0A6S7JRD5_PARCT|nr:Stimulator of interferon genes [Paramuricea clavata]
MTDNNPPQNQGTHPNSQTPQDDINWENPPKKRKCLRLTSIMIFVAAGIGIITYGVIERTITEYEADNDNCAMIKKENITCYTKKEKTTYPVLFNLSLGLFSIILGTIVDRLSIFVQELFQLQSRYNGEYCKVFKSCFRGVHWAAIFAVIGFLVIIVCLIYGLGREPSFHLVDIIYILGGIGVGPLLIHLLNLNTNSEVDVSIILEEMEMYPGYTLAWSYYFNHLVPAVHILNDEIKKRQKQRRGITLSLHKLLLLLPPSTHLADIAELTSKDEQINKLGWSPYPFPVYEFTNYDKKCFAMQCVNEPIKALRYMKELERIKFVTRDTYKEEVKRFYKTLCEIIEDPPDDQCAMMGLVVPVTVRTGDTEKLQGGGLARIIMDKVNAQSAPNERESSSRCCFRCCCCFCCCSNDDEESEQHMLSAESDEQDAPVTPVDVEATSSTSKEWQEVV